MKPKDIMSRRSVLTAPAVLALASAPAAGAEPGRTERATGSKTLTVYFTRSGNTSAALPSRPTDIGFFSAQERLIISSASSSVRAVASR